ncbi:hypothetical protein PLICRDRAFT_174855 [Plicaturopsis crispa FD-325 SS-3]|nr:hypothetical protein PLICRDRAFT_174855 [Plicaturopsis crispa FD-325 SS-3]
MKLTYTSGVDNVVNIEVDCHTLVQTITVIPSAPGPVTVVITQIPHRCHDYSEAASDPCAEDTAGFFTYADHEFMDRLMHQRTSGACSESEETTADSEDATAAGSGTLSNLVTARPQSACSNSPSGDDPLHFDWLTPHDFNHSAEAFEASSSPIAASLASHRRTHSDDNVSSLDYSRGAEASADDTGAVLRSTTSVSTPVSANIGDAEPTQGEPPASYQTPSQTPATPAPRRIPFYKDANPFRTPTPSPPDSNYWNYISQSREAGFRRALRQKPVTPKFNCGPLPTFESPSMGRKRKQSRGHTS